MSAVVANPDRLLSRIEAAEFLNLKPQTLAIWSCTGKHLPVVRLGRTVRYRLSDLESFIQRRTTPATT